MTSLNTRVPKQKNHHEIYESMTSEELQIIFGSSIYSFMEAKFGSSYHRMTLLIMLAYFRTDTPNEFLKNLSILQSHDPFVKYYGTQHLVDLLFLENGSKKFEQVKIQK